MPDPDTAGVARVEAYPDRARNEIYNLLFADDIDALEAGDPQGRLGRGGGRQGGRIQASGGCLPTVEGRRKTPPGDPPLLGTIVEIALDEGLDTLAAYADGRIRYINHAGGMSMVEDGTAAARAGRRPAPGVAVGRWTNRAVGRRSVVASTDRPGEADLPGRWRPLFRPGAFRSAGGRSNGRASAEYSHRVVVGSRCPSG